VGSDPFQLFDTWLNEAVGRTVEPTAMCAHGLQDEVFGHLFSGGCVPQVPHVNDNFLNGHHVYAATAGV